VTLSEIKRRIDSGIRVTVPRLTGPVDYTEQPVGMSPYLMGVWLAEGGRRTDGVVEFSSGEQEMLDLVDREIPIGLERHANIGNRWGHTITNPVNRFDNSVRAELRGRGVFDTLSGQRFVPDSYKHNTQDIRLAVLQGLMDGDGTVSKEGYLRFEAISKQLVYDVYEIAASLGFKVNKPILANRKTVADNDVWRVNFTSAGIIPFRLSRKIARTIVTIREPLVGVRSVEFSRTTDVRCISVDSSDELYVTDDFIVTHNTRTRKSTAKNKFLAVVREWEKHTGGKIELASDFTSEGLTKALGERDGLVSLMHRDEIQGFFLEAYNKTYMSGIMGTLTDLYDGFVRVVLRSTKDSGQSRRSESTFNFLGIGITYDVAEVLTDKNFRDGFLARFLWSIADPPELTRESEDMQQAVETGVDAFKVDAQITAFCNEFSVSQRRWKDKNVMIRFDNASMKRFNDWKWQTAKLAEVSINKSSVEPSRQRLALSVWKCAALLAMHERKDTITLAQLLPVLEQAESWYSDMERMAGLISANDFQRKVNALEAYVLSGAGQRRNIANVYKTMLSTQGLRKSEVDEVIQNLIFQGRIKQVRDEGKVLLEVIA